MTDQLDTAAIRARMEALAGFSAGPWIYYADLPSVEPNWHIVTTSNKMRVLANVHIEPGTAMDVANARLIAAAPDMHEAILALSERCRVLEEALSGLEWACDQLASTRTHEVYLAMIDGGQAYALLSLDSRRQAARAVLAQKEGK